MLNQTRSVVILTVLLGGPTSCLAQVQSADAAPAKFTVQRVLLSGQVLVYPTLADVNADGKPDLLIGSMGHDFEEKTSRLVFPKEQGLDLSIHLNKSNRANVLFDSPYWPKDLGEQCRLPGG